MAITLPLPAAQPAAELAAGLAAQPAAQPAAQLQGMGRLARQYEKGKARGGRKLPPGSADPILKGTSAQLATCAAG